MTELILNGKRVLCVKVPKDDAHYFIDDDGDLYKILPPQRKGRRLDEVFLGDGYSEILGTLETISEENAKVLTSEYHVKNCDYEGVEYRYGLELCLKDNGINWTPEQTILLIEIK